MSLPSGNSDTGISLKLASPSGMPMTVRHSSAPVTACPMASQMPEKTNQMTFPMVDPAPAPGLSTTVRPNGHSAKRPMRNEAIPNGMPMIVMHHRMPTKR